VAASTGTTMSTSRVPTAGAPTLSAGSTRSRRPWSGGSSRSARRAPGITRIAKALNEDTVAPPRHAGGWAPTAIREILRRPLYRGVVVWNRKQKRDRGAESATLIGPSRSGSRSTRRLRIVPEDMWLAAHRRLDASGQVYVGGGRGSDRRVQE